jgi:hypothetical protein
MANKVVEAANQINTTVPTHSENRMLLKYERINKSKFNCLG